MKELSQEQLVVKAKLIQQTQEASLQLDNTITLFNQRMAEAWEMVEQAMTTLNGVVDEVNAFSDEVRTEAEKYFESQSENWQKSEAGQNYQAWINELSINVSTVSIEPPDTNECLDYGLLDSLESLPERPYA